MSHPDLSVIVVSWNTRTHLAGCLTALPAAAGSLALEIVVVDNGSRDGTPAMVRERFPEVRLIENPDNEGFARASNAGARASAGRALLFLNSDCEPGPGTLPRMLAALDEDVSVGGVFCRLLNADGSLQPSVHRSWPTPWSLIADLFFLSSLRYAVYRTPFLHRWLLRSARQRHAQPHDVAWGGAACMLVRRAACEAVGGFDEAFFMYCEDMDLCKRIRGAGYRLRYLPEPYAVHHWGRSTAQLPLVMLREAYRSRVHYFEKHFPGWGGSWASRIARIELSARRLVFSVVALLPTRHRPRWRQRAVASAGCLAMLRRPVSRRGQDGAIDGGMKDAVRINFGCGGFPLEGWVNVDRDPRVKADVYHDMNAFPYPFESGVAMESLASHVLEHTEDPFAVMAEFARVVRPGGLITVRVPHFSRGFTHPDHRRGFDVSFPLYFRPSFPGGFCGTELECCRVRLRWLAQPELKRRELGRFTYAAARAAGWWFDVWANLAPELASRVWCFWAGGFDEVEFVFRRPTR